MTIDITSSTRLNQIAMDVVHRFQFPAGIPAFENVQQFELLQKPGYEPFFFLKALPPADLTFVCVDPFLIHPDYQPNINDEDVAFLELQSPSDLLLLSLVTVAPNPRHTTANLHSPLAINLRNGRGKQIICEGTPYPIRYRIWDWLTQQAESKPARSSR